LIIFLNPIVYLAPIPKPKVRSQRDLSTRLNKVVPGEDLRSARREDEMVRREYGLARRNTHTRPLKFLIALAPLYTRVQ